MQTVYTHLLIRGMVATHLGWKESGEYDLPAIKVENLDVNMYRTLIDTLNKARTDGIDVWDYSWVDMQERALHDLVKEEVDKFRVYAMSQDPNHPMFMSQRDIVSAAEIAQIGKECGSSFPS